MDYSISRFSTSTESDITIAPSSTRLESTFCRNFTCCGQRLDDLHDLLQHYEECHVRFEDDEMPAMITDDDLESSASSSASTSHPPSPRTSISSASTTSAVANASTGASSVASTSSNAEGKRKTPPTSESYEATSAFDTAVMRSPSLAKAKKRSFGQCANNPNGSNSAIHQSLRRALIDGGVGRRTPGQPNIYAPNSPFSTPGSSIPGTPSCDSETDAFFGNGVNPSAFSSLSIRSNSNEEHHLPSCAPPNLFFPASGSSGSNATQPPAKRERMSSTNSASSTISLENALKGGSSSVDKPYKCPAPGCDKAYKQMNGLKYHRLHGHCNQNNLPIHAQAAAQPPTITVNTSGTASPKSAPVSKAGSPTATTPKSAISAQSGTGAQQSNSSSEAIEAALANVTTPPSMPPSPTISQNSASPPPASPASNPAANAQSDRLYICQVGACGKRYKNLNGLRYHYLHSGQHGLLGMQLLQSGGGSSAKVDATGRAPVSTSTLSSEEIAAAAQAAQAAQEQMQAQAAKSAAATAAAAAAAAAAKANQA